MNRKQNIPPQTSLKLSLFVITLVTHEALCPKKSSSSEVYKNQNGKSLCLTFQRPPRGVEYGTYYMLL